VERFKNMSNVMKFRSFGDSTSSRVKDKLKTICLCKLNKTKRLLGLKDILYHDRLVILDTADTLEIKRLMMDLIMLFKITHNLVALDFCIASLV